MLAACELIKKKNENKRQRTYVCSTREAAKGAQIQLYAKGREQDSAQDATERKSVKWTSAAKGLERA